MRTRCREAHSGTVNPGFDQLSEMGTGREKKGELFKNIYTGVNRSKRYHSSKEYFGSDEAY